VAALLVWRGALDQTPALIGFFITSFVLLGLLTALGAVINLAAKRRVFNGAAVCFWIVLAFVGFLFIYPNKTYQGAYLAGQTAAVLIPALVTSFLLSRRFRKKSRQSLTSNGGPARAR
jgi:glucan phosphoethanolaminetransferase (alkaline phosphatase superfamily)